MKAAFNKLSEAAMAELSYSHFAKEKFHSVGRAFLRKLAKHLDIQADVRSCKGGPAVGGEVILHSDKLYIQLSADSELRALIRSCNGRKDYVGGRNLYAYNFDDILRISKEVLDK